MILLSVIILFFLFVFIATVSFIVLRFKRNKTSGTIFGIIIICIALFVLLLRFSFPYWSIGSRHLWYAMSVPNLHSKIILGPYDFSKKDLSAEYEVNLKYLDEYSVGICLAQGNFPKDFEYTGKIRVEFYHENELIHTYIPQKPQYDKCYINEEDGSKLVTDKVELVTFDATDFRKYRDELKIKVTVVEPDESLKIYDDNLCLYVGIDRLL